MVAAFQQAAGSNLVVDGSFETPAVSAFQYGPLGCPGLEFFGPRWNFRNNVNPGYGGFCTAGSIPDGNQFAFLQEQGTYLYQSIDFPQSGMYSLDYYARSDVCGSWAAWPYGPFGGDTSYEVLLDSTVIQTRATPTNSAMLPCQATFEATAGVHTLEFLITSVSTATVPTTDQSALIDNVGVYSVSSWSAAVAAAARSNAGDWTAGSAQRPSARGP